MTEPQQPRGWQGPTPDPRYRPEEPMPAYGQAPPQYPYPPQQPYGQPQPGHAPGQQPPKKKTAPPWLVAVTIGIVSIACIGGAVAVATSGGGEDTPSEQQQPGDGPADPIVDEPQDEPAAEPDPAYFQPKPKDFELSIKTLEKQCFGSAGCNIVFRVELGYATTGMVLDPAITYELTYEIKGGDDPYINTLTVTGDEYSTQEEEFLGTPSGDAELRAVVTDVSEF